MVDWNDVKVDRWAWQLDNSPSSSGLHSLTLPLSVLHLWRLPCLSPSHLPCLLFILLFTQTFIVNMCPKICPVPPCFILFHSLYSFIQCHYGPVLTEAFIKCQLYTRDHTVEGEETMIFDPKRSTCLWALSACWRTVRCEEILAEVIAAKTKTNSQPYLWVMVKLLPTVVEKGFVYCGKLLCNFLHIIYKVNISSNWTEELKILQNTDIASSEILKRLSVKSS